MLEGEVLVATRTQATRDFSIISEGLTNRLDPSSRNGMSDKVIIDATAPLDWEAERLIIPAAVRPQCEKRCKGGWRSSQSAYLMRVRT